MLKEVPKQTWFVENYQKAGNIFGDGGHLLPIASPIFSVVSDFKRKFGL